MSKLGRVRVPVALELGRVQLSVDELLSLRPGAVVALDRMMGEPLAVVANGATLAHAEVVQVDGRFAMRLTDVVQPDVPEDC